MADINILEIDPKTRRVSFSLNLVPTKVDGIVNLLQLCIKTVLTTTGYDSFSPLYGGSLKDYLKKGIMRNDIPSVSADIVQIVSTAESHIKYEQQGTSIPDSEKLKSMKVTSIEWNYTLDSLDVFMQVTSVSGVTTDINLGNQLR